MNLKINFGNNKQLVLFVGFFILVVVAAVTTSLAKVCKDASLALAYAGFYTLLGIVLTVAIPKIFKEMWEKKDGSS